MPAGRPKDEARRSELLGAIIDNVAAEGIGRRSLRDIADRVGTTHRMLIHHFASREGLLTAIVDEVERRTQAQVDAMYASAGGAVDVLERSWSELAVVDMRGIERLFYECYARGANHEQPFDRLHTGSVTTWLDMAERHGVDRDAARLGLAVMRGLLLDLVATDDEQGTGRAMALIVTLLRSLDAQPPGQESSTR
jgi:AcrR family transcriptional regulator